MIDKGELVCMAAKYLQANEALHEALETNAGDCSDLHPLGEGEHNLNFWFCDAVTDRKFVLRINVAAQPFHQNQVRYEYEALRALEPSGRAPQPFYVDDSAQAPGKGVLVIGFCEGQQLDFDHLRPGDLECAAQLMADIHAVPVGDACPLFRPENPLRTLFDECVDRYRAYRASAFEDARVTKWVERFLGVAEPISQESCSAADRTHIVNTETLPSHFLIPGESVSGVALRGQLAECLAAEPSAGEQLLGEQPAKGPSLAGRPSACSQAPASPIPSRRGRGRKHPPACSQAPASSASPALAFRRARCQNPGSFVDWERPVVGEVAQDVAYFVAPTTTFWDSEFLFPADAVGEFVESYWRAVDGRFDRGGFDGRFRAWRMMTALRSVTWCCRALVTLGSEDSAAHMTEKAKAKLPIYLSDDFMNLLDRECFR